MCIIFEILVVIINFGSNNGIYRFSLKRRFDWLSYCRFWSKYWNSDVKIRLWIRIWPGWLLSNPVSDRDDLQKVV